MGEAAGRWSRRVLWHLFLVVPFLFYYRTSAPGIGSSDTALIVDEMKRLFLSTHANHHNLTLLVGHLFLMAPGEDPARLANLASVFLGATAIALFYLVVLQRSRSGLVSAASASGLMVSHSMWWHSTIVEAYAWNAVLTVVALGLLQRLARGHSDRTLAALFFVAGISLFNHVQMGILLVGAGAYLAGHLLLERRRKPAAEGRRLALLCAASLLLGFTPYAITFVADAIRFGGMARAFTWALGGDFRSVMAKGTVSAAASDLLFLLALQFPTPFLLAAVAGAGLLCQAWKGSAALLALVTVFTLNTAFFAFYNTWDKFAFLLPSFVILGYAGSFAVERAVAWAKGRALRSLALGLLALASVAVPPLVYARLHDWSRFGGPLARFRTPEEGPLDTAAYLANPDKSRCTEFEDYARSLFGRLPERATYIDDDGRAFYPVRYFQDYRGMRRDLRTELVNYWGFQGWGLAPEQFAALAHEAHRSGRPLFLVSIGDPYYGIIVRSPGLDRLRFRRFPLDERRTIYRLVPAAEEAALPPEPPLAPTLWTAAQPPPDPSLWTAAKTAAAAGRHHVGPRERVFAVLEFQPNGEPFEVEFRWLRPGAAAPAAVSRVWLPFGVRRVWSELDLPRPLGPGSWRVEAASNGGVLAAVAFEVR